MATVAHAPQPKRPTFIHMPKLQLSVVTSLAFAASIGFAGGYAFHSGYGSERSAARQAVFEAQSTQRVLQAYEPIINNLFVHKELASAKSLEDIRRLQLKYRESTLRSISFFEARAKELELPNEKRLAQPFLQEAEKVRKELHAAP